MMRAALRSIFCVLVLGVFTFDMVQDAACLDGGAGDTACCACSCGSHLFAQPSVPVAATLRPTRYASFEHTPYAYLSPSLIFHPPRLAA